MSEIDVVDSFKDPFDVPRGYSDETPFHPEFTEDLIGLRIEAPAEAPWPPSSPDPLMQGFTYVPISLTWQFSLAFKTQFDVLQHHITVVAIDVATAEAYTGPLQDDDPFEPGADSSPELSQEMLEQSLVMGYYTFNLCDYLDLPEKDATYHVHATLREHQSNVVTIAIRKRRQ